MDLHGGILDLGQNFREVMAGKHSHRSGSFFTAPIMYLLIKQMKLKKVLEIGIGAGSAGYWLGHAAKEMDGIYYGIELHQSRINGVSGWMKTFGIPHKMWCFDTIKMPPDWVEKNIGTLDFVYLDGCHKKEWILHEMEMIWPHLRRDGRGYLCIHDIYSSSKEGWREVKELYAYSEIADMIEIHAQSGMGILRKVP